MEPSDGTGSQTLSTITTNDRSATTGNQGVDSELESAQGKRHRPQEMTFVERLNLPNIDNGDLAVADQRSMDEPRGDQVDAHLRALDD